MTIHNTGKYTRVARNKRLASCLPLDFANPKLHTTRLALKNRAIQKYTAPVSPKNHGMTLNGTSTKLYITI